MPSFGRYGAFPLRFGGSRNRASKAATEGLLEALSPAFDVTDSTLLWCECYADGVTIGVGWAASRRLSNQSNPLKMCEALQGWEEACSLRPNASDTLVQRRAELAAKLRGQVGNTLADISDACAALCGMNFAQVYTTAPADEITYWPMENPGPPGFEWASNVCELHVRLTNAGLTDAALDRLVSKLKRLLDEMCPAWVTFDFYVADSVSDIEGFYLDQSLLGINGL